MSSRNVCIISCKSYKYIRVCESYRNAQGKPRSRVVENHGRLEAALAKDPDYVVKLRERIARENDAARAARTVLFTAAPAALCPAGSSHLTACSGSCLQIGAT